MADMIRCSDRFAHIRIKIERERWQQYEGLFDSQPQALGDLRRRIQNQISAALIDSFEADLERSHAAAKNSDKPR